MGWFDRFSQFFSIKYVALLSLALQNTFLPLFMHYTKTRHDGKVYSSATAVVTMEWVKLICCILVLLIEKGGIMGLIPALSEELLDFSEILRLSVPSLLYTIQNNLLFFALSHLDAATYQVGYQVKILTTAVFSVTMLGRSLSSWQWISLVLLTIGVSLAQLSATNRSNSQSNTVMGIVAVLLAATTSGFAGVYFEKILKSSGKSLWMRNVQMGVSSVVCGYIAIFFSGEYIQVLDKGFFYGYNGMVVAVVLLQAVGGLIVAVVVKYADNILKAFAASFSIITSSILSYFFMDFVPNGEFLLGALFVNISIYLYSYSPNSKKDTKDEQSNTVASSHHPNKEGRKRTNSISHTNSNDDSNFVKYITDKV